MVILHIANIGDNLYSGVRVVVPQHINAQSKYADVAFINICNIDIPEIDNQFDYKAPFSLEKIPVPFCKPDLVIFQECYCKEYLGISKYLQNKKVPYIIIPHGELGNEAQQKKHFKKVVANLLLFNRFIRGAEAIQCLSQREYDATRFGKRKIIATNGVMIPKKQKKYNTKKRINFVYIGRLDAYHKGLDLLIEAIKINQSEIRKHNCFFYIYGPDFDGRAKYLNNLIIQANIEDLVKQYGPVIGKDKEAILLNSDIFIQTSRFEGMPLGILEALSYGLPCLVTKGTTLGDEVKEKQAGWCAENNSESISDSILTAINSKDLYETLGKNAKLLVEYKYEWDSIAESTINTYRKLLGKEFV